MSNDRGAILFEVLIAMTIFALSAVSLIALLQSSAETANMYARDTSIRYGLHAIITEARHLDVREMQTEYVDELLGIVYRTEVDRLQLENSGGKNLRDLYRLTATATSTGPENEILETAEIWVYRPREDN